MIPFLEISIVSTIEKNLTHLQILDQISQSFLEIPQIKCKLEDRGSDSCLKIIFNSEEQFRSVFNEGFQIYSFIFEQVKEEGLNFDDIEYISNENFTTNSNGENYLVTFYHSNLVEPIRKNHRLATAFNRLIGCHVSYEEIANGYIRFIHTKEDYLSLTRNFDTLKDWEMYFKEKNIDLDHPTIEKFLKIIEKMVLKFHVKKKNNLN